MEGMLYFRDFFYINVVNLIFFEGQKNTILQGKWSKKFLGIKGVKCMLFDSVCERNMNKGV